MLLFALGGVDTNAFVNGLFLTGVTGSEVCVLQDPFTELAVDWTGSQSPEYICSFPPLQTSIGRLIVEVSRKWSRISQLNSENDKSSLIHAICEPSDPFEPEIQAVFETSSWAQTGSS